jgi:hypothetical protein
MVKEFCNCKPLIKECMYTHDTNNAQVNYINHKVTMGIYPTTNLYTPYVRI